MGLFDWARRKSPAPPETRGQVVVGGNVINLSGGSAGMVPMSTPLPRVGGDFEGVIRDAYETQGVVAAAVLVRALLFSEVIPVWRDVETRALERDVALAPYTDPMAFMAIEQHASYAGNAYATLRNGSLMVLRPDWVKLVIVDRPPRGVEPAEDPSLSLYSSVEGYLYCPPRSGVAPEFLPASTVLHYRPEPHPTSRWLGGSWVTRVMREIAGDRQAADFTANYFENGGAPRLVHMMDPSLTPEQVAEFKVVAEATLDGVDNAGASVYLGGAQDLKIVGSDLEGLSLRDLHGGHEARIAVASRVPSIILGTREGQQGAGLMQGNYGQTRRQMADFTMAPMLSNFVDALATIAPPSPREGLRLEFDPREMLFLQEDQLDRAKITQAQASSVASLVAQGYTRESVAEAVAAGNLTLLEVDESVTPVQVQAAESSEDDPAPADPDEADDDDGERSLAGLSAWDLEQLRTEIAQRVTVTRTRTIETDEYGNPLGVLESVEAK